MLVLNCSSHCLCGAGYYTGQVGPLPPETVVPRGATPFAVRAPAARRQLGLPSAAGVQSHGEK